MSERSREICCATCAFLHAKQELNGYTLRTAVPGPADYHVATTCRRHPPQGSTPVWPNVNATDWCGEWLPVSVLNKRVPRKR